MKVVFIILLVFSCQWLNAQTSGLAITITNIRITKGVIRIGIYNNKTSFPKEGKALEQYTFKVTQPSEKFDIHGLPRGVYAIALFHDENSDGICNTDFFGIPKEGYGFSNNYKPKLSAPSFNDCKFVVGQNTSLTIKLIN